MTEILFKEESYRIIQACMTVHNHLGPGFLEPVYQEALGIEFSQLGIPYEQEKQLPIRYRGVQLGKRYFVDFLCFEEIIVELKAVKNLLPEHEAQVVNYLKASDLQLGILVNFSEPRLRQKRLVRLPDGKKG